jgi:hypothetical protein
MRLATEPSRPESNTHLSNPYRGFKWLPLYGVCIALLGAIWHYFSVLRHV